MNSIKEVLTSARANLPKLPNRAENLTSAALAEYELCKSKLKPDQSINMICTTGSESLDVYNLGMRGEFVRVVSRNENREYSVIIAPVEQVSFQVMVSKKNSDSPPREIGFHAEQIVKK